MTKNTAAAGFATATAVSKIFYSGLLVTVGDTSLCKVVGGKLDVNAVAHQYPDAVPTHAARDRSKNDMLAVLYLDLEECVGLFINDDAC